MSSDHDQCLNCLHARKPIHPAPGQCKCASTGTLVDVSAVCDAFVPADMARRIAEGFRASGGARSGVCGLAVGMPGSGLLASCSASTTATKSHR